MMRVGVVWMALAAAAASTTALASAGAATSRVAAKSPKTATISAAACARNKAAGPLTFVSPFGYDASAGILDVFSAQSLGYTGAVADLLVHLGDARRVKR